LKEKILKDPEFQLWAIMMQASDLFHKARSKELKECGVTFRQAQVLFVLVANQGESTIGELARWLFRASHTISILIYRMERAGLVSIQKGPNARSPMKILITEKGRDLYDKCLNIESIHEVLSVISPEEREQLFKSLKKIRTKSFEYIHEVEQMPYP